jgi:hypothetical protein
MTIWYIVGVVIGSVIGGFICAVIETWIERTK